MKRIEPATAVRGTVLLPGDKSISHRAALLGALATEGVSVDHYAGGADGASTLGCLERLGVRVERNGDRVRVMRGEAFRDPEGPLDAGNSGTTARTLCGLLAGIPGLYAVLSGDESLQRRPMRRVVDPLRVMGARIDGRNGGSFLPLGIRGTRLSGGTHRLAVASAQVKTALLLSGLSATEPTTVVEPLATRDHTERLLAFLGIPCTRREQSVTVFPCDEIPGGTWRIPGDFSAAAFWIVAAALVPDSEVCLPECGINPTRTGALAVLRRMGLVFRIDGVHESGGEPVGNLTIRHGVLGGTRIEPEEIPFLVDELPVIAVAASQASGVTEIRGAAELRVKESDRIAAVTEGLRALGGDVEEREDGWVIRGGRRLHGGKVRSFGDHRIAMAFAVAALAAEGPVEIDDERCVAVSDPRFFETLDAVARRRTSA